MQIVFLIKPNSVNIYSYKNEIYESLGVQKITYIEKESHLDYENRMIYIIKDIAQDFIKTDIYKNNKHFIKNIKVILTNPWCVYEIMNLEKSFTNSEIINQKYIDKLIINKDIENISILKNSLFNIDLNGYSVKSIKDQKVNHLHVQYLSIYTSTNFLNKLIKTLDVIFNIHNAHNIQIDSIYSHINENIDLINTKINQIKIIIEDIGFDISYIYENKNIATFFIKSNHLYIKDQLKKELHIDENTLDKILKSKSLNLLKDKEDFSYNKNINNIWLDLDENIRLKIDNILKNELSTVQKEIRVFIDNIENNYIKKDTNINIYCLDNESLSTFSILLENYIKNDLYIINKLLTNESNVFTKKIF